MADWTELMVICDNCGHAIHVKRTDSEQDVVEVVRCKDCLIHGVCRFEQGLGLDGFCSQGERKE